MRSVALPTEHGGWSLTLEPALLGLLVAPSVSGLALAAAALTSFVVRTPLKVGLVDRRRRRRLARTRLADIIATGELALVALLIGIAAITADGAFWVPLLAALPLVMVALWYDARSRSRRVFPELAGTVGIGAFAAAIALAGGADPLVATGLWAVVASRAVASIPFVRVQILRLKGHPHRAVASDVSQLVALAGATAAVTAGAAPVLGAVGIAVLAVFQAVATRLPPPRVAILGAQQIVLGLVVVLVTGLAVLAP